MSDAASTGLRQEVRSRYGEAARTEYLEGLTAAGFTDASVIFTTEAAPGMHSAIIRAVKPAR